MAISMGNIWENDDDPVDFFADKLIWIILKDINVWGFLT